MTLRGSDADPFKRWSDGALAFMAELDALLTKHGQAPEKHLLPGVLRELERWQETKRRFGT